MIKVLKSYKQLLIFNNSLTSFMRVPKPFNVENIENMWKTSHVKKPGVFKPNSNAIPGTIAQIQELMPTITELLQAKYNRIERNPMSGHT